MSSFDGYRVSYKPTLEQGMIIRIKDTFIATSILLHSLQALVRNRDLFWIGAMSHFMPLCIGPESIKVANNRIHGRNLIGRTSQQRNERC